MTKCLWQSAEYSRTRSGAGECGKRSSPLDVFSGGKVYSDILQRWGPTKDGCPCAERDMACVRLMLWLEVVG